MAFKVIFFVMCIIWTASALKCNVGVSNLKKMTQQRECENITHCVSLKSGTDGTEFVNCDDSHLCEPNKPSIKIRPMGSVQTNDYKITCCKSDFCNKYLQ